MNAKLSTNLNFKRMFTNILSIFVILAMGFPVTGSAFAQEYNPGLRAFPDQHRVDGSYWPAGELVNLTIDGNPFEPQTADDTGYVEFLLGEYDLKRGDILTLSSGDIFVTHTARQLFVDDIDLDAQTVSGTVDGGQQIVHVWIGDAQLYVDADQSGNWYADFSSFGGVLFPGVCGNAEAWEGPGSTIIDWCLPPPPPNPHFTVFPEWEFFDGLDWPDGAIVSISVEGKSECHLERESWGGFFNGNFPEGCNVEAGDTVAFDDGTTNRWHKVRNLYVTDVDTSENTVTGKADAGETVYVWPHDGWFEPLQMLVGGSGVWQVDLDEAGYTIREDSEGRSEIRDGMGNATASDWHVTHPRFTVFPEWEWFDGNDWPNEATVTITVAGKPECETTKESWGYFFNGNFGEGCDIVFGDMVTFTDGETVRTQTVQNLSVTDVDVSANVVGGKSDTAAVVDVWPHETGQQLQAIAVDGNWLVDFTGVFDLVPGICGRSQILDEFDNATAVDWCAPKPWLMAFPENEAVEGWEWPDGATINMTIDNAPGLVWEGVAAVTTWGDPRTYVRFDLWEDYNLQAGDVVTLTDGTITRTHTVQNLSVVDVNADTDTVSGTADVGAVVTLWPHGHDQIATLQITTGDDGAWLADFATVGFNLVPGIGGRSEVGDEAGNRTAVDWAVPMPGWEQLNVSGFGDPLTRGVSSLEVFRDQLYVGASNWETGGQVWRLEADGQWLKVIDAGFGTGAANPAIIDLAIFRGQLYAGTGWNTEAPGQVWRSSDGVNWQPVTTDGFGDTENIAVTNFAVFKGILYAGTGSVNGSAQIWRSSTGQSGSWRQVAPDGSGLAGNVTGFAVYKGALYAAVEPAGGFGGPIQVWRSVNGSQWVTVTADGFGDARNESTGGFAQFGDYLYLGTRNEETGAQLWRTRDGIRWEMVVGDGFGDLSNIKIESLVVYDDYLYAATYNPPMGLQLWRSADGMNWEQVIANGFGDSNNFSTLWNSATAEYQGQILIGTWNDSEGGEVWRYTP